MKSKKRTGGFTLVETLIVVFILALIAAAGAVGISGILSTRTGMIQTADAEILGSTALQTVANELRFGQGVKIEESSGSTSGVLHLSSTTYGPTTIGLDSDGKLVAGTGADATQILTSHTYSGLKISYLGCELERTGADPKPTGNVILTMTIGNGRQDLWSGSFTTRPLNGTPAVWSTP